MTQAEALNILKLGYNVFLTGPPGSGKTFLLNKYIDYLKQHHKAVAVTASTGIAATHMNGITLHSWSGLGIRERVTDQDIRILMGRKYLRKRIKSASVLVIDEISMLKPNQFDAVDKICQYFKASFAPFGGMQVVCSGDFFQLPPIERNGETKFIVESNAWKNMEMKTCYLEGQFRHRDQKLSDLLNHIRDNQAEESKKILLNNRYSENQLLFNMPTRLYTHNVDVDAINNIELNKIEAEEFAYQMTSKGPKELVASLKRNCLSPETLLLKQGAQVMFIKNNFEMGYVNGTQGRVIGFNDEQMPIVETFSGRKITAKMAGWTIDDENDKIKAQINQIPLRLAWAITIHKSQGMNLDTAEIDLSKCFVEGMGYVAISRLRTLAGLKLVGANDLAFYVNEKAVEMDKEFREMSDEAMGDLRKMPTEEIKKEQKRFLQFLSKQ